MITLNHTDQMPATTDTSQLDFTLDPRTTTSTLEVPVRHETGKGVKAMAFLNRPERRVRASEDRALERAMVLEAMRRQRMTKRSVYEQVYRARVIR